MRSRAAQIEKGKRERKMEGGREGGTPRAHQLLMEFQTDVVYCSCVASRKLFYATLTVKVISLPLSFSLSVCLPAPRRAHRSDRQSRSVSRELLAKHRCLGFARRPCLFCLEYARWWRRIKWCQGFFKDWFYSTRGVQRHRGIFIWWFYLMSFPCWTEFAKPEQMK